VVAVLLGGYAGITGQAAICWAALSRTGIVQGQAQRRPIPFQTRLPEQAKRSTPGRRPHQLTAQLRRPSKPWQAQPRCYGGESARPLSPLASTRGAGELLRPPAVHVLRAVGIGGTAGGRGPHSIRPTSQGAPRLPTAHHHPPPPFSGAGDRPRQGERPLPDLVTSPFGDHRKWRRARFTSGDRRPKIRPRRLSPAPGLRLAGSGLGTSVLQGQGTAQRIGACCRPAPAGVLTVTGRSAPHPLTARHVSAGPAFRIAQQATCPPPLRASCATGQAHS